MKKILLTLLLFITPPAHAKAEVAILAAGCFWCIEKDFEYVEGVMDVHSGYIGGTNENPTYENHAKFGHREAVRITFDENIISYQQLLHIFWRTADPTDANGQFCDRGPAYTTAIYALSPTQTEIAKKSKQQAEQDLGQKIVTPILPASKFTPSETYHQDYYKKNPIKYRFYRATCGRDKSVKKLWGNEAYKGVGY